MFPKSMHLPWGCETVTIEVASFFVVHMFPKSTQLTVTAIFDPLCYD